MSPNATKLIADIEAGVIKNVSVGYRIFADHLASNSETDSTWLVTDWEPFEVSFVTVPADPSVGLGRAAARAAQMTPPMSRDRANAEPKAEPHQRMEPNTPTAGGATLTVVESEKQRTDAVTAERNRVSAITAANNAAREANLGDFAAKADEFIREGKPVEEFQRHVLDNARKTPGLTSRDLNLSDKEAKRFSFTKVIEGMRDGNLDKVAAFEVEVSNEIKKRSDREGSSERIAIPLDVALRGYNPRNAGLAARMANELGYRANLATTVATSGALSETGSQAGAHLLSNDLLTDLFIESLREEAILLSLGVTMLTGLTGNVRIPREITNPAFSWVAEDRAPTGGDYDLDEIALTFRTLAASIPYTRQTMKQSTPNIENLLLNNLRRGLALAIDNGILNGSGSSNQPTGIFATAGIGAVTSGGAPSFANLLELWADLRTANADRGNAALVTNTLGAQRLLETPKDAGSGQFLANFAANSTNMIQTAIGTGYVTNTCPSDSMVYGDFRNGYMICDSDALRIQVLNELYAVTNQIGYLVDYFGDGAPVISEAFARVKLG
jgi:HK97 family phage major capsid protein